jgi:hypothetical protein
MGSLSSHGSRKKLPVIYAVCTTCTVARSPMTIVSRRRLHRVSLSSLSSRVQMRPPLSKPILGENVKVSVIVTILRQPLRAAEILAILSESGVVPTEQFYVLFIKSF